MAKICKGIRFKQKSLKLSKRNKGATKSKELFIMVRRFKTKRSW